MKIKVEISARHIHLTEEDYRVLFGEEEPTKIKELSQKDNACREIVKTTGPRGEFSNVRVLVPFRNNSQLEISRTDSIALGIDAPLKLSGDLPGAKIKISGPKGEFDKEIAIVAKRHLHLPPDEAKRLNLNNGDKVEVKIKGERGVTFSEITVRIKDHFTPAVHVDTDEANAAGLRECTEGELIIGK